MIIRHLRVPKFFQFQSHQSYSFLNPNTRLQRNAFRSLKLYGNSTTTFKTNSYTGNYCSCSIKQNLLFILFPFNCFYHVLCIRACNCSGTTTSRNKRPWKILMLISKSFSHMFTQQWKDRKEKNQCLGMWYNLK